MSYPDENKSSPFRSRGFIISAIVLGAILLLALVGVVIGLLLPKESAPEPTAAPTTSPEPVADQSVCGLDDVEVKGRVTEAPAAEWSYIGRVAVPSSNDAGPGTVESDGFRSCYSRTPEGAVFAGANFVALTTIPELGMQTASTLVAAGPGRDAAITNASKPSSSNYSMQIAGFKQLSYDGESSSVDVAVQITDGTLASYVVDLIWEDGDWKAVFTDAGQPAQTPIPIQSLGGYTPWSE